MTISDFTVIIHHVSRSHFSNKVRYFSNLRTYDNYDCGSAALPKRTYENSRPEMKTDWWPYLSTKFQRDQWI